MNPTDIIDLLQNRELLNKDTGETILDEVASTGASVFSVLENYEVIDKDGVYNMISQEFGAEYLDLSSFEPPKEILAAMPGGLARLHGALPVSYDGHGLHVALVDPFNAQTVEDLRFALGQEISVVVADVGRIEALITKCYETDGSSGMNDILSELTSSAFGQDEELDEGKLAEEANSAPIVRYVDLVITQAIRERASDIHFEPFEDDFKIRYRVDGALYEMAPPPAHLTNTITSRVKVMSNLNIAERRIPQDGRIMMTAGEQTVDLRVSTLPTVHGESVVLRVLDRSSVMIDLDVLGLPPTIESYVLDTIVKPNGIFIVTGPTGAGKTTTLYAALRQINTVDAKLLTVEDPVEYDIDGIIQVPVNESVGVTFGKVLRAFLRQDPDRIMVGEMRDVETAQIAIQASLTGHLVLSTLHTNDAPGAVTRLVDMGCEPFLVSATLEAVLAQRLLRTICPDCRVPYEPNEAVLSQLGLSAHELGDKSFYTGEGCDTCNKTGYKGRRGLFELLEMSDPLRELICERAPTVVMMQKAIELGMTTLREDGLRNIFDGATTIEEVLKYT